MIKVGIYKITNLCNEKCYIGQSRNIYKRWSNHKRVAQDKREKGYNYPLYTAFRKYGLHNFKFEILEECLIEELDNKEIYWIDYYNSFVDGYNATFGGQKYHKILPNAAIIQDYYKTRSARKTALNFHIDHSTVDDILNQNNIPRFSFRQAAGQRIRISKKDFVKDFDSVKDCAEWFVNNRICKTTKVESARTGLKNARAKNVLYYGYLIENI